MNYFVKKLKAPSAAITAMIDGLLKQDAREDFEIDMLSYGHTVGDTCFGCAAACAVQEATGVNYTPEKLVLASTDAHRAEALGVPLDDLDEFEVAIDMFRKGYGEQLLGLFGVGGLGGILPWCLDTEHWRAALPLVKDYRDRLMAEGL